MVSVINRASGLSITRLFQLFGSRFDAYSQHAVTSVFEMLLLVLCHDNHLSYFPGHVLTARNGYDGCNRDLLEVRMLLGLLHDGSLVHNPRMVYWYDMSCPPA
jgi:hypothetical protein